MPVYLRQLVAKGMNSGLKKRSVACLREEVTPHFPRKSQPQCSFCWSHIPIVYHRPAIACPHAWEFSHDYSCCVPKTPFAPLPICPAKHSWDSVNYVCQPSSSSSSGPKPSSIYGRKSKTSRRAEQLPFTPCPLGLQKCPISGLLGSTTDDYEW